MENPEVEAMAVVDWQLFVTLTFQKESLPDRVKITLWFAWLRELASMAGVPYSRVLWFLRSEAGELNGRHHFHALIAGLPPAFCIISNCFRLMCVWDHEVKTRAPGWKGKRLEVGMARVRKYASHLDGVAYVLKGLIEIPSGADIYEFSKFGGSQAALMLSDSLFLHVDVRRKWSSQERRRVNSGSASRVQ